MTIQLNDISKRFVSKNLFDGLSLEIGLRSRIGLIGRNGCGKSTLLKLIMNHISPDEGSIYRAPGLRVNYLSQEPRITPNLTLEAELLSVFTEVNALHEQETALYEAMGASGLTDAQMMALAHKLDNVHQAMERLDARSVDARIGRILKGLGFSLADYQRKSSEFSGGWQMRINLAKVLLEGADILLLDEPTNHLDLEACEWLENFLREYPGGLVIVSHDRQFLDQVTTETAELELGKMTVWPGNYSKHLMLKEEAMANLASAHERQTKELAKQTAFVERFRASATRSTQAKSREKQLAKIERIELPEEDNRRMAVRFPSPQPSGKQMLTLRDLSKGFQDIEKPLFSHLNADFERGQRIFLLGDNGCGKTTLLRLILGLETPDTGNITFGHNVLTGYFSQNQLDTLDPNASVFDTMQRACPDLTNTELRTLLGRFLFTKDEVFKPVKVLSGGEKSKLALARLMMSGPNTLFLDEPTNHMDMPSKDVMTEAFQDYEGSILCISHDRYFIQALATDIWEIYEGHLIPYCGNYDYYRFKRTEMREQVLAQANARKPAGKKSSSPTMTPTPVAQPPAVETKPTAQTNAAEPLEISQKQSMEDSAPSAISPLQARKEIEKQLKKIEKQIVTLEEEIAALQTRLDQPDLQQDYQRLQDLSADIGRQQSKLHDLNDAWAKLAESLS